MRRVRLTAVVGLAVSWVACGVEEARAPQDVGKPEAVGLSRAELTAVDLLQPAPTQTLNTYDFFGQQLSSSQAFTKVLQAGLNPFDPNAYARIGLVAVNSSFVAEGKLIFENAVVGDNLGFQRLFGFKDGLNIILPELTIAILQLNGRHTTNLKLTLLRDLQVGSTLLRRGSVLDTGLDVEAGALLPLGLRADFNITCAICHVTLDANGNRLNGVPNGDLNAAALVALAPNTASVLGRLNVNVTDASLFTGLGKQVIDSRGAVVRLPDPDKLERRTDDVVLGVPPGHFESSIDRISNTTQIPHVFTWGLNKFTFDGAFQAGPFRGLSAANSAVHSSEVNIVANAFDSQLLDIDSEVYDGILLQAAADSALRLPAGAAVRPSSFLRAVIPNPADGEFERQVIAPGSGPYPNLLPTLSTYNGLIWSPNTNQFTFGAGKFFRGANAMSAYQDSLKPPPNRTPANQTALSSGAVARGAQVFLNAGCNTCHTAPFFTDNKVHPNSTLGMNPARAESRRGLDGQLSPPRLYAFDENVPVRANARVLNVPTAGITDNPTRLPFVTRDGGYKTLSLRALFLTAPYFHDGGAAVAPGSLSVAANGSFTVVDPTGLGIPGAVQSFRGSDAAASLRAVVDSSLRALVVAANRASPSLVRQNLDGSGHRFFVDGSTGYTPRQQADLVDFLLSLDDNPGAF